jgi:hypothetical protein
MTYYGSWLNSYGVSNYVHIDMTTWLVAWSDCSSHLHFPVQVVRSQAHASQMRQKPRWYSSVEPQVQHVGSLLTVMDAGIPLAFFVMLLLCIG